MSFGGFFMIAFSLNALLPVDELPRGGELSEKEKVRRLLVSETVLALVCLNDVLDVDAAVVEFAGDCLALPFIHDIAVYVAYRRESDEHARAVVVPKAPLDAILRVERRVDVVGRTRLFRLFLEPFPVYHLGIPRLKRKLYHKSARLCAHSRL